MSKRDSAVPVRTRRRTGDDALQSPSPTTTRQGENGASPLEPEAQSWKERWDAVLAELRADRGENDPDTELEQVIDEVIAEVRAERRAANDERGDA